tara:strand:+ start:950 stop:1243 length:294 start_codon:yes stop_codon:yes gene_type:complete
MPKFNKAKAGDAMRTAMGQNPITYKQKGSPVKWAPLVALLGKIGVSKAAATAAVAGAKKIGMAALSGAASSAASKAASKKQGGYIAESITKGMKKIM